MGFEQFWRHQLYRIDRILAPLLAPLLVVLGGYLWLRLAGPEPAADAPSGGTVPSAVATGQPSPTTPVLTTDAPGDDLADLPRYPAAVRVASVERRDGGLATTAIAYEAEALLDEVRSFYRETIDANGWAVGDVTYTEGRWTFLLIKGTREAVLELESAIPNVAISMLVSMPVSPATSAPGAATARPTASAQPTPPPGDDGDDAGEGDG